MYRTCCTILFLLNKSVLLQQNIGDCFSAAQNVIYIFCFLSSDLSLFFDGLESLLEPLTWQHSVIPALSPSRLEFLEAPTPFLMGVLVQQESAEDEEEDMERWWEEELR